MIDNLLSQILYGLSGFFFGLFAVRLGHQFTGILRLVVLSITLFIFPVLFYTRTPVGGFVYLATYIFYNMRMRQK